MKLNSILFITILSMFEYSMGSQHNSILNISELCGRSSTYECLMYFEMKHFEKFNLRCYLAMFVFIQKGLINNTNKESLGLYYFRIIRTYTNTINDHFGINIWQFYNELFDWITHSNINEKKERIQNLSIDFINKGLEKHGWLQGLNVDAIIEEYKLEEIKVYPEIEKTYKFCDITLSNLSPKNNQFDDTLHTVFGSFHLKYYNTIYGHLFNISPSVEFGNILLLMKPEEFEIFQKQTYENAQINIIIKVMREALLDIFNEIIYMLYNCGVDPFLSYDEYNEICNNNNNIGATTMDIIKVLYTNAIETAEEVYKIRYFVDEVADLHQPEAYSKFITRFKAFWSPDKSKSGKHYNGEKESSNKKSHNKKKKSRLANSSLLRYYASTKDKWTKPIPNSTNHNDKQLSSLMELYAWLIVIQHNATNESLKHLKCVDDTVLSKWKEQYDNDINFLSTINKKNP